MPGQEFWSPVEFRVSWTQNSGLRWNARSGVLKSSGIPGKWNPEFWTPVECQVRSSGIRWNSGLVESRILKSVGIPGLEFWIPVEFRVSGTHNTEVRWNASSGLWWNSVLKITAWVKYKLADAHSTFKKLEETMHVYVRRLYQDVHCWSILISFQFFSKIWVAKLGARLICGCGVYAVFTVYCTCIY